VSVYTYKNNRITVESKRSRHKLMKRSFCSFAVQAHIAAVCRFLANVNSSSRSLYVIVRPSVCCLSSVTFVHPTQTIEIFGNVSMPCGTLAIHNLCVKIVPRSSQGNPYVVGLNPRGVAKYSDFRLFEGYISETVQYRR